MTREEITAKVKKAIQETIGDPSLEVTGDSYLVSDLELGSLEVLSMLADLEDEFDTEFDEKEIYKFVQVHELIDYIEKKLCL